MVKLSSSEEEELFDHLMKYRETVFCICLGFSRKPWDAEELTQETYLKEHKKMGSLKLKETAKEWLLRIARNTCLDYSKKEKLRRLLRLEVYRENDWRDNPEFRLLRNEQLQLLKRSIRRLPRNQREILILREYGQLSYKEIAKTLGIKEGTVMSRLSRARQAITEMAEYFRFQWSIQRVISALLIWQIGLMLSRPFHFFYISKRIQLHFS